MVKWNVFVIVPLLIAVGHAAEETIPSIKTTKLADNFDRPVCLTTRPGGASELYVVEQAGTVTVYDLKKRAPVIDYFLDIRDRVKSGGETGLLSLAFHPRFAENRRFFVDYTRMRDRNLVTIVSEWKASDDFKKALPDSEKILLEIRQPYTNHNGGLVLFGPDGMLYIGMGDGGSRDDPQNNGQNRMSLLGKILRIDVDGAAAGRNYGIPKENPFIDDKNARPEIWAWGMRNPWRFSFDRKSGAVWAGDVGQNAREEIDIVEKGGNYGWRVMEGTIRTPGVKERKEIADHKPPIWEYNNPEEGQSVTGGYVYRGKRMPTLEGTYLFADYVRKKLWGLRYDGKNVTAHRLLLTTPYTVSSFGEDNDGELYLLAYDEGAIYTIEQAK